MRAKTFRNIDRFVTTSESGPATCDVARRIVRDIKTGKVIEFRNERIEALQEEIARELGYKLVDHRLELYAVPLDKNDER